MAIHWCHRLHDCGQFCCGHLPRSQTGFHRGQKVLQNFQESLLEMQRQGSKQTLNIRNSERSSY